MITQDPSTYIWCTECESYVSPKDHVGRNGLYCQSEKWKCTEVAPRDRRDKRIPIDEVFSSSAKKAAIDFAIMNKSGSVVGHLVGIIVERENEKSVAVLEHKGNQQYCVVMLKSK